MPDNKPHVKLINAKEDFVKFSYKTRFVPPKAVEEEEKPKDYRRMAERFESSLTRYTNEQNLRVSNRTIQLPIHIDYIDVRFQNQFDLRSFSKQFLSFFGLDAVKLTEFNRRVLFAIVDINKFKFLFEQIRFFISFSKGNNEITFDNRVTYIDDFSFLSSKVIKQYKRLNNVVRLSLLEGLYNFNFTNQIEINLDTFL